MSALHLFCAVSFVLLSACAGSGGTVPGNASPPRAVALEQSARGIGVPPSAALVLPEPYTPDVDAEPGMPHATFIRPLTVQDLAAQKVFATELSDPNRAVFHHSSGAGRRAQNVVAGGNGESVGLFTGPTFTASGSVAALGIQQNYFVLLGGNFFHTHQLVNNQCFEYGINYSSAAPTLFAYNWCTGGNTPQGFLNSGLVGDPGGVLNTWDSTGNGGLFSWDAPNGIYRLILEEVRRANGWHLLAYNWTLGKYIDLMNGRGVTGTKGACCGWVVFENHAAPGASCNLSANFPTGQELLYDVGMKALIGKTWRPLNQIANGGFNYGTKIDCANISGQSDPAYASPFFSGGYVSPTSKAHAGDWWMIQS